MTQETKDLLTLLIALWGATLSSILAVREFFKDRRRVAVTFSYSIGRTSKASEELGVHILNVGHRPIEIQSVGIQLSDGTILLHPSNEKPNLPIKLFDSDSVVVPFLVSRLEKALYHSKKETLCTAIVVFDSQGKTYRFDPYKFLSLKGLAQKRSLWKRLTRRW